MDISIFLARLMGLYLVIVIPAILIKRRQLHRVADNFANNIGLIYISGFFNLVAGLLVVLSHNIWTPDWRSLITLLGWLGLVKGIARFYAAEKLPTIVRRFTPTVLVAWCLPFLAIGLYLAYIGFFVKT